MSEKITPGDVDNFYMWDCEDYQKKIDSELQDETLTKQEVIVKALERVAAEANVTVSMIRGLCGGEPRDKSKWHIREMPFSEFLNELPGILNDVAVELYFGQRELNRAVFLREKRDGEADCLGAWWSLDKES